MGGVSPVQANVACVFPEDAVNNFRVQWSACRKAFAVIAHRPEEWSLKILAVFGEFEVVTDALCSLRVNGQAPLFAAFTHDLQSLSEKWSA
jgi:hypothetical protein